MVLAIVPGNLEVAQVPQMITLSFNGAVNVDNIPIYQELFAEGKTEHFIWCHLVADFVFIADIVRRLLLAAHLLGILVNLLLCKNGLYLIIKNNMPNLIFLTQLILNTFNIFGSSSNFKYGNFKGKAYVF